VKNVTENEMVRSGEVVSISSLAMSKCRLGYYLIVILKTNVPVMDDI
jgi:hypothetical protein